MRKKLTLLISMLFLSLGMAWAQTATLVVSRNVADPEFQYRIKNANNVWMASNTAPTQDNIASFAFFSTDNADFYKIYSIDKGQWVSYDKSNGSDNCRDFVKFADSQDAANAWKITTTTRDYQKVYQIQPQNNDGSVSNRYMNWNGGVGDGGGHGYTLDDTKTVGLWRDNGSTDGGSAWVLVDNTKSDLDVANFENGAIYTFVTARGWMGANTTANVISSAYGGNGISAADVNINNPNFQWTVYKSANNKYYLYNIGKGQFMGMQTENNAPIPFAETPAGLKMTFKQSGDTNYPIMFSIDNVGVVNHSTDRAYGLIYWTGGWNNLNDEGSNHKVVKVGELDDATLSTIEDLVANYEATAILKMPEAGKYYRIMAVDGWNDDARYLGSKNYQGMTRAEYVANADAYTIFYFDGDYLKSYATGNYLVSNSNFLGYNGEQATGSKIGFQEDSYVSGVYNISFNDGGRWLYVNQDNYTDAGGSTGNSNGYRFNIEEVTELPVAEVGGVEYASLAAAITAASAGSTITFVADINESVTLSKNVTIDGAGKTYTGTMSANNNLTVTVQNVNFVNGGFAKNNNGDNGTYTIKDCTFDGADSFSYAVRIKHAKTVNIQNCIVKNYQYGFLYVSHCVLNVNVEDVTVEDFPNYAVYFASGVNSATFEKLTVKNSKSGIVVNNAAARTLTIKDCKMENVTTAINHSGDNANVITANVQGANDFGAAVLSQYVKCVLAEDATLAATTAGLNVTTNVEGKEVVYQGGKYSVVVKRDPAGQVAYRADVTDKEDREGIAILLKDPYAKNSLVVKVYNGNTLMFTCTRRDTDDEGKVMFPVTANTTANIVLSGKESGSWINEIHVVPTELNVPNRVEIWADGVLVQNYEHESGTILGTNLEKYLALECVKKFDAKIGNTGYETLAAAIEAAQAGETVTLLRDVAASDIITINKAIALDGNGKKLTSTAGRAINIETEGKVVINNLTVKAAERAFNIINKAATVELNDVTATASNNAVMIATSAGAANVTINGCDFTGLAVVNVAGAGAQVAINDTKITNVDANEAENYGAITVYSTATNAKVTVNGGSINVADDSKKAYIFAEGATVTGVDQIGQVVAMIGDAGYETLTEAIADAKEGQTVKMVYDATGAGVVIDKSITIDFGGKTYTFNGGAVGSSNTKSNGFQILKGNNVTLKNGALNVAEAAKGEFYILIQNYANLNVEGMTLDGTNLDKYSATDGDSYVLSNNSGTVNVTASTLTANNEGNLAFALDACDKSANGYALPVVTVDTESTINGNVEVSATLNMNGALNGTIIINKATGTVNGAEGLTVTTNVADHKVVNNNGAYTVAAKNYVAQVGEDKYETFAKAIAAASAGQTITLLADINENVTLSKSLTIDGAGKNYTGNIAVKGSSVVATVKDVNFVDGSGYAITTNSIKSITVENCTVTNYGYGFLYANKSTTTVTVKNVKVDGGNYGFHWVYGTSATLEDVKMTNVTNGLYIQNYANKTITLKNCEISSIGIWERNGYSGVQTFKFKGVNEVSSLTTSSYAKIVAGAQVGTKLYETLDAAFAAAQDGDEVKVLTAGTYALSTSGKDITITGAVDGVVFDNIGAKNMGGANVTFNNVTFDYYPNVNYTGLQHSGNLVYNNCTINGQVFLYGQSETFNKCTFNQNSADAYNVWTYGAKDVDFNECTFNSVGKSVLVYNESTTATNDVAFTNCVLKASAAVEGKAAIEIDTSLSAGATITVDGATTATGFGSGNVSGNSLWNNKKGNADAANNDVTIVVNGETVLAPIPDVAKIGETGYRTLAEAIAAIGAGDVVIELLDNATFDYNARDAYGTAETTSVTINGNGHTLTLNQKNSDWASIGLANANGKLVLNDMTIEKTGYGDTSGAWNTHAIIFSCPVEMTDVKVNNGIAVQAGATLNNVTINEANGYYGLWINGNGQAVTVNGGAINATNGGRGIKIADQYIDAPAQVTLNVNGTVFSTAKKAAVLVSSKAGAQITADNVDITNVAEDKVNFVWVDEDWSPYFAEVEVTGATKAQEGIEGFVAQLPNGASYKTLAAAITAATSGQTITLIGNTEEDVTVSKNLTIEGADMQYTGVMTLNKVNVTVQNLNFVKGQISKSKNNNGGNVTIVNCNFDGQGMNSYAVNMARTGSVVIENVTAQNYGYGFLQLSHANNELSIKDVEVMNTNYALKIDYSNGVSIDGLKVEDVKVAAIYNSNYGAKTYTITNSDFSGATEAIKMWERSTTVYDTFVFAGGNTLGDATLSTSQYAIYKGVVAEVGTKKYLDLRVAFDEAQDGETVKMLDNVTLDTKGAMDNCDGYSTLVCVEGKSVTIDLNGKNITANAYAEDLVDSQSTMLLGVFATNNGGKLTLVDSEGTATVTLNANDAKVYSLLCNYEPGCQIKVEGGTYVADKVIDSMIYSGTDADENQGVTVNGGNFTLGNVGEGANGKPWIFNVLRGNEGNVVVNGGTFNADINHQFWANEVFVPETKALKNNGDGTWTVVDAVAYTMELATSTGATERKVGYATLAEAVAAVKDEGTVTLVADATGAGVVIDKDVTIDFNGKIYTFNQTVGSTGTTTLGFQILKDNNVTLKNGVLTSTTPVVEGKEVKMLIQNYANLTLEDMNLVDATDEILYVLSNNCGETELIGNTNITTDAVAFDSYKYGSYAAPTVYVNTTGKIVGAIEKNDGATIAISSGTFTEEILPEWCAEYYVPVQNAEGEWTVEYRYIDEKTFVDGQFTVYDNNRNMTVGTLTYERYGVSTGWNQLYVPFEVPVSELADKGFEVAYINGVRRGDDNYDGELDDFVMELIYIHGGNADGSKKTLKANYPYFIRYNGEDGNSSKDLIIKLEDVMLYAAKNATFDCTTFTEKFEITGTTKTVKATDFEDGYSNKYGVNATTGKWRVFGETATMRPFRFYMAVTSREDNSPIVSIASMSIVVRGEELPDGTTLIYDINAETGDNVIYDLNGRRVLETEKGNIYIINGKKVLVK